MKEEALKLADDLEELHEQDLIDGVAHLSMPQASAMIRRIVEELDEKNYRILELTKRYKALTWNDKQSEPVVYWDGKHFASREKSSLADIPLYTTPQIKELSDEELNKAFDYYCETDEGVLRFNYELRDEWKKEQLIRWKEAFKKASEK